MLWDYHANNGSRTSILELPHAEHVRFFGEIWRLNYSALLFGDVESSTTSCKVWSTWLQSAAKRCTKGFLKRPEGEKRRYENEPIKVRCPISQWNCAHFACINASTTLIFVHWPLPLTFLFSNFHFQIHLYMWISCIILSLFVTRLLYYLVSFVYVVWLYTIFNLNQ